MLFVRVSKSFQAHISSFIYFKMKPNQLRQFALKLSAMVNHPPPPPHPPISVNGNKDYGVFTTLAPVKDIHQRYGMMRYDTVNSMDSFWLEGYICECHMKRASN